LPIVLPEADVERIAATLETAASPTVTVNLLERAIIAPDAARYAFAIADDRRMALIEGLDETSLILRYASDIEAYRADAAAKRPWLCR
jgi:3-isopropylmalate dehydratase small subunit